MTRRAPLLATEPAPAPPPLARTPLALTPLALVPLVLVPLALAVGCTQAPADGGPTPSPTPTNTSTAAASGPATEEPAAGALAPAELVPVPGEPATEEDALPTIEGRGVDDGIQAGSARRLGATDRAEYWVALDEEGHVCFFLSLAPGGVNVARTCGSAQDLAQRGVWVKSLSETESATGLLVPDGFDLDDAPRDDDWVVVAPNLAVPVDETR